MTGALVVDAGVVLRTISGPGRFELPAEAFLAPPLLWSEVGSALHEAARRGEISAQQADECRASFVALTVVADAPPSLYDQAWSLADEFGWAKTYDAEYVGLARIRGCRLVTTDFRLHRGADRLGFVVGPTEL